MADSFMSSFNQGLNLAHTIENDKRLQQAQAMQMQMQLQQQQYQQMQMLKMAHDMAKGEEYTLGPDQVRYRNVNGEAKEVAKGIPKSTIESKYPAGLDPIDNRPVFKSPKTGRIIYEDDTPYDYKRGQLKTLTQPVQQITYLQTAEGFIPMPTRGGGMPPTGKPVAGSEGTPIGKPIPAGEASKLGDLQVLLDNVGVAKKNFDSKYVGPVAGRIGSIKEQVVDLPEQQVTFYAAVRDAKDALLRARSGAQINEQEYQRLVKFLPDENQPSGNFVARMNRFEAEIKNTIAQKKGSLRQGGYGTGVGGNAPNSNYPPMENTLPKGAKTGKYNGQPAYSTDGGKTVYHALTNERLK